MLLIFKSIKPGSHFKRLLSLSRLFYCSIFYMPILHPRSFDIRYFQHSFLVKFKDFLSVRDEFLHKTFYTHKYIC